MQLPNFEKWSVYNTFVSRRIKTKSSFPTKKLKTDLCFCVDDFGIKYHSTDYLDHIINTLRVRYAITTDWEGKHFGRLAFDWNYKAGYIYMAMPGYITNTLKTL